MSWRKIPGNYNLYRCFCTSNANFKVSGSGSFLNKIMSKKLGNSPKSAKWYAEPPVIANTFETNRKKEQYVHPRRVHVLNKLFMKHVTDLLSTGEISDELLDCGLEITHVNIDSNYKLLRVYWYSRNDMANFEKLLPKYESSLRHELCQLKLMGVVPPVKFIKNLNMFNAQEIQKIFLTLDMGPDKDEMKIEEAKKQELIESDGNVEENEENEDVYACDVPEMTHNAFNVNHSYMMQKVKDVMKKVKSAEARRLSTANMPIDDHSRVTPEFIANSKQDIEMLKDFLKQRKINDRQSKLSSINAIRNFDDEYWFENANLNYLEKMDLDYDKETLDEKNDAEI